MLTKLDHAKVEDVRKHSVYLKPSRLSNMLQNEPDDDVTEILERQKQDDDEEAKR